MRETDMKAEKTPYTFILGLEHGGSSHLAFLLNAHPEIATLGEIERLRVFIPDTWNRKTDTCFCGRTFYACPFWNRVLAGFAARGHGFDEIDYFTYSPDQKQMADDKLKALAEAVLDVSGKRVFLDASKFPRYVKPLFENPHLDVRIINLYRDGRASINLWLNHLRRTPSNRRLPVNWWRNGLLRQITISRIIWAWRRQETERQSVLATIPTDRVLSIKYEDLVTTPQKTLRSIFAFLRVDEEFEVVEGSKFAVEQHIIGNQMLLHSQEKIIPDDKRRTEMEADSLFLFRFLRGERLNRKIGYAGE